MKRAYLSLHCRDLSTYVVGDLVDEYFRGRENRVVMGALLHYLRTHRRESLNG